MVIFSIGFCMFTRGYMYYDKWENIRTSLSLYIYNYDKWDITLTRHVKTLNMGEGHWNNQDTNMFGALKHSLDPSAIKYGSGYMLKIYKHTHIYIYIPLYIPFGTRNPSRFWLYVKNINIYIYLSLYIPYGTIERSQLISYFRLTRLKPIHSRLSSYCW